MSWRITKILGIFLCLQIMLGGEVALASEFSDVDSSNQNYEAIKYLKDKGVISGYEDGTYRPWNPVSRIELLKIVMNAKGLKTSYDNDYTFDDIGENNWYAPYVSEAYRLGYVNGNNGRFYPNNTVTKAECLKILFNIMGVERSEVDEDTIFSDVESNSWYGPFIKKAKDKGYIEWPQDNYFKPHQSMNRGEVAEVIYRVVKDIGLEVNNNNFGGKVYKGAGTYTISIGDRLYDDINDKYLELFEENSADRSISFSKYDGAGNKLVGSISKQIGSPFNGSYYEQSKLPIGPSLMNHLPDGEFRLEYLSKEGENRYKIKFDYAIRYVYERAVGLKKILVVPVYLSDVRDKVNDHWKVEKYILKPAFEEIKNYIKVKQLEYLGKEVMWFDVTIANYVTPTELDSDFAYNAKNGIENRFDLVKKYLGYEPTDFDVVFYDIYTNQSGTEYDFDGAFAMPHQAYLAHPTASVSNWDFDNSFSFRQQRSFYSGAGLHEILHNLGMNDLGKNQGKLIYFVGNFYNVNSLFCLNGFCPSINEDGSISFGFFQNIDDFVAHEIGWTDRNGNEVLDALEYGSHCTVPVDSKYDFCKEGE